MELKKQKIWKNRLWQLKGGNTGLDYKSAFFSGIGGCSRAEIELRPVIGGVIGRRHDPETGTGFWSFGQVRPPNNKGIDEDQVT